MKRERSYESIEREVAEYKRKRRVTLEKSNKTKEEPPTNTETKNLLPVPSSSSPSKLLLSLPAFHPVRMSDLREYLLVSFLDVVESGFDDGLFGSRGCDPNVLDDLSVRTRDDVVGKSVVLSSRCRFVREAEEERKKRV